MKRSFAFVLLGLVAACKSSAGDAPKATPDAGPCVPPSGDVLAGLFPTELVAASGQGKVLLAWNAPPGAGLFTVYRGTEANAEDPIPLADGVDALTYLDETVTSGTRYFYRVRVAGDCHGSLLSNEAAARPRGADPGAAFAAFIQRANPYSTRILTPTPLLSFDGSRLPQPIADDNPDWITLYTKAWETAFHQLRQPTPQSGFVSNFIDPGHASNMVQWDALFMMQFGRYANPYFNMMGSLDNFYAKQAADGFICREFDQQSGAEVHYRSLQDAANPPLYSWAEWQQYRFTGDKSRFGDALVPIAKHYDWVKRNRTLANGAYWNTGLGAGEDDLLRGYVESWQDMTTQQAQNALYSALIATVIENDDVSAFFVDEYLALVALLQAKFWDSSAQMFTDLQKDESPTGVKTVLGLWPLLAHVASFSQTDSLVDHVQNPSEFWRPNLLPVLAADQPGYTPRGEYWNGAVWAPTNFMATTGLQIYGRDQLANSIARTYLTTMADVLKQTQTIWEHYAPESATGLGVQDFVGWSGLGPIAMLIESVLGIRVDAASNAVVWRPMLPRQNGVRNLAVGGGTVDLVASDIQDGSRTLTITTTSPIRLAVDTGAQQTTYEVPAGTKTVTVPAQSW